MDIETSAPLPPNHHAHFPAFSGPTGLLFAAAMATGRDADAELALRLTGTAPGDAVVDIGCGSGAAVRLAAKQGATAIGVDPSEPMRLVGRWLTRRSQGELLEGSAEALPVADGWATVAWSLACVHHWSDLEASLAEVVRVLRPGGRFLAMERHTSSGADGLASHGWTEDQAEAFAGCCNAAGLVDVQVGRHQAARKHVLTVLARRP
jgi:ubiquinone/menaquinone biosynthesis C-methylase UbiE